MKIKLVSLLFLIMFVLSACSNAPSASGPAPSTSEPSSKSVPSSKSASTGASVQPKQETSTTGANAQPEQKKPAVVVGLAQGKDYAAVTAKAIANSGGLEGIVKKGNTVLIKPNLCWDDYVDSPITTDYRVVSEIANEARKLGAGRIIIAEGPFGPEPFDEPYFSQNRYNTIKGVEFLDFNYVKKEDCYYTKAKNSLTNKEIYIPKIYVDADVVITVPKLKTHDWSVVTLGLKNCFGVPPMPLYREGMGKGRLHTEYGYNNLIVEINMIRKPDFVVIDGIVAGEGNGPTSNKPVQANTIIAGRDILAVDTVGARFMGFTDPGRIEHLALAAKYGLGQGDLPKIQVVGGDLAKIALDFQSIFPKSGKIKPEVDQFYPVEDTEPHK